MSEPRRPNILIFMTDHQRADSVLPSRSAITPNLDRFAREGVTFTNTYCPAPHCCPSRATFYSGLYPSRHGVWNNVCNRQALSYGLNEGVRLWSEDLADAGYQLHHSGKWHVSVEEWPRDRGWLEHFVSAGADAHHGVSWEFYRELANRPEPTERKEGTIARPGYGPFPIYGPETRGGTPHDEKTVSEALKVLDGLVEEQQPWCLFVGAFAPHDPYVVLQRYLDLYDLDDVALPPSYGDELADKPAVYQRMREQLFGQMSEREIREGIRHFRAYCSYVDDLFGRILDGLERTRSAENTMVLFCSDHGDYCGDHGMFTKGAPCFRGAYHVPAIIRWPAGLRNPGRFVDHFVSLADFAPTFLEVTGIQADRYFTGASLVPFLRDETPADWRDEIHTQFNGQELYYTQRSVMTRDYKYVFNGFDWDELYDLRRDPDEMVNLARDPAYDHVTREMCGRMWRFACREDDTAINPYIMASLAPYGPAAAFR